MRIAVLSVHSSPLAHLGGKEAGGMNVYVREMAHELARRGMLVDIFTRYQDRTLSTVVPLAPGVRVINLPTGPAVPYDKNWVLTYLPEFVSRLRCFADGEDLVYDIIHSHYWLSGEAGIRLRRSWGIPLVHMFHTLGVMKNQVARSSEETETTRRIAIERRLLHAADAVVAATPLDRAQMVWHYGADAERIHVIPCGVDLQQFRPQSQAVARRKLGLDPDQRLLLCVGRMEPLKGMDCLIRALALLQQRQPAWRDQLRVLLVGGGSEEQPDQWNSEQRRLAALRDELDVTDAVSFIGAQPQQMLPDYYAATDVVAVPSHYESFGLVALEALACATPVVASDVGGLSSTIEDGRSGFLVPPDNPPALAARLERVLTDDDLRRQIQQAAYQRALYYGWDSIAPRMALLYDDLIRRGQVRRLATSQLANVS
jgi:D-inositol-3-phosphate glycosyltransferase